uniref:Uncharacterized protein n=1 Tax=Micrurus corallinus TaxID=54390 RepID=A0A2D4ELT9_MICCO
MGGLALVVKATWYQQTFPAWPRLELSPRFGVSNEPQSLLPERGKKRQTLGSTLSSVPHRHQQTSTVHNPQAKDFTRPIPVAPLLAWLKTGVGNLQLRSHMQLCQPIPPLSGPFFALPA